MAMLWGCTSTYDDSKNGQTIKSAEYKVEHWKENADNDGYTLDLRYISTGSVGEETNESETDYTGFTVIPFSQQIIKADGSTTVKIYYKRKIVNLTFDYNDGTNKIVLSGKYGASHPTIPNPTRSGYVFAEWIPSVTRYIPVVDKTYTARWTTTTDTPQSYTVIYDANGGTGYMENQQFNYNEEKQLQPNSFVREYFTFAGWAISPYSSSPDYTNCQIVSNLTFDDEITLYAVWTENGKVSLVIFTPTVKDVDYGDTVTLVSNTSGAEIHYTTNGSEPTVYSAIYESPIKITSDTTIKAIAVKSSMRESDVSTADYTIKNYTVTFSSEYSTAPAQITGLRKGDILTASQLPELSKTGYTFDGWYYSGTKINAGYEITCSIKLTAQWTENKSGISITIPSSNSTEINLQQSVSGNTVTFTANSGFDSYAWYIDGTKQSCVTHTFNIDTSSLKAANYDVTVIVSSVSGYYSASVNLKVKK